MESNILILEIIESFFYSTISLSSSISEELRPVVFSIKSIVILFFNKFIAISIVFSLVPHEFLTEDGLILEEGQNIIFIELPKIRKIVESLLDKTRTIKSLTAIQKWGIFIKELNVK